MDGISILHNYTLFSLRYYGIEFTYYASNNGSSYFYLPDKKTIRIANHDGYRDENKILEVVLPYAPYHGNINKAKIEIRKLLRTYKTINHETNTSIP